MVVLRCSRRCSLHGTPTCTPNTMCRHYSRVGLCSSISKAQNRTIQKLKYTARNVYHLSRYASLNCLCLVGHPPPRQGKRGLGAVVSGPIHPTLIAFFPKKGEKVPLVGGLLDPAAFIPEITFYPHARIVGPGCELRNPNFH